MRLKLPSKITCFALQVVGTGVAGTTTLTAFDIKDRAALWCVVNDLCRPMQQTLNLPIPCLKVDTARGFTVIRAPGDETQILIVPMTKIEGLESPIVLEERMPNI
jgi:CDP-diacylglycerol pyrophosphatase